jgi:hypothetical protein
MEIFFNGGSLQQRMPQSHHCCFLGLKREKGEKSKKKESQKKKKGNRLKKEYLNRD